MFTFIKPLSIKSFFKLLIRQKSIFSLVRDAIATELGVPDTDIVPVLDLPAIAADPVARKLNMVADAILWMNTSDAELVEVHGEDLKKKIQKLWAENKKLKNITIEIWIGDFAVWGYVGLPTPKIE